MRLVLRIQTTIISLSLPSAAWKRCSVIRSIPAMWPSAILSRPLREPDGRASIDYELKE